MYRLRALALASLLAVLSALFVTISAPAQAATLRNGVCESGEFCYAYNSNFAGSISDHGAKLASYGATKPSCYTFRTPGKAGYGQCIKNNAASVWNRTSKTIRVYYNSNYSGKYVDVAAGVKKNLYGTALYNQNASHGPKPVVPTTCKTYGAVAGKSCSAAVTWAKGQANNATYDWYNWCDRFVRSAYEQRITSSGHASAKAHWSAIPSSIKFPGNRSVPAGGLAFFDGGTYGHVMISIGGGYFVSTDFPRHEAGIVTIAQVEQAWGQHYAGWSQPWF